VAGGTANTVRLMDVGAKAEAGTLAMPEEPEKQRREKFVLSVAYSPGGWGRGQCGLGQVGGWAVVQEVVAESGFRPRWETGGVSRLENGMGLEGCAELGPQPKWGGARWGEQVGLWGG